MKSLTGQFEDWAARQPPSQEYDFLDIFHCAISRFGKEIGLLSEHEAFGSNQAIYNLHYRVDPAIRARPWTFGALAERLRGEQS